MLNSLGDQSPFTWQTSSFIKFSTTLFPAIDLKSDNQAFEAILYELSQSGVQLLEDQIIENVFSQTIDELLLTIDTQITKYQEITRNIYSDKLDDIKNRITKVYSPLAAMQLSREVNELLTHELVSVKAHSASKTEEATKLRVELTKYEKIKNRDQKRQFEAKRRKRKKKKK